jgi:predicted phosphate transport protein (TIGR00153 family)
MPFSLIPREEKFFDLLEEHAKGVEKGVALFREICHSWSPHHPGISGMKQLEHECDINTHEILDKLNRTFITPLDREDIHSLAKKLDDIIDNADKIATRMELFGIEKTTQELCELANVFHEAVIVVVKAVASIRDLKRPQRILDYCVEINRLEGSGDRIAEKAILNLFQKETNALEVIKWKEIYDLIEESIDMCEDVANIIEATVVKYG